MTLRIVTLLLQHGANRNAKNACGGTPVDFARDPDVIEALNVTFKTYTCTGLYRQLEGTPLDKWGPLRRRHSRRRRRHRFLLP